jgi:ferredoxin--NADP+ reductase
VHLVLIHGVRFESQLAYADELRRLSASHGGKLRYLALVTRQEAPGAGLRGRIPALIRNGTLETSASLSLDAAHSHVMLCGNPAMLAEAQVTLSERGLLKHRKRKPGHVTVESYW